MSKKYPECPLYNHDNCKDLHNPKLCAIVRKDKKCLKKNPKSKRKKNRQKQHRTISKAELPEFIVSVDKIERLTGLDFNNLLDDALEDDVEAMWQDMI